MNIIFIGDICFKAGRVFFKAKIKNLIEKYKADFVVANGENMAGGKGINQAVANELFSYGCDIITTGNHIWAKKEVLNFIDSENRVLRPYNYSKQAPGRGYHIYHKGSKKLAVINMSGQVGMLPCDNPFAAIDDIIRSIREETKCVVVDFHAEATSEKIAFAYDNDGRVSAVIGTHTHVQTADERILPFGTGVISDAGMTGPFEGIIGCDRETVINRFRTGISDFFNPQKGLNQINGVFLEIEESTGQCNKIERIYEIEN
ncbi:MAG: TIGR00282 family metallophosphoesterase [Clostridia bacterium]|nr:TIGR00282 family metallophosphoesterase [Clostridia bacterium]